MSLLGVGTSGLAAAYAAINAASNNVANVNTPGYSRQQTVQTTMPGQYSGIGFTGRGVAVATIQRAFDAQTTAQLQFAQSQASEYATQSKLMSRVDRLFASDDLGINAAMDRFFSSLTEAAARPADLASRATVIATGTQMAGRLNSAAQQLDEFGRNVDLGVRTTVVRINEIASQIARTNDAISLALGTGQTPNDLMDQRDELIRQLNEQVGVTTLAQSDGSLNVFLTSGPALVVGAMAGRVSIGADPIVPDRQIIGITSTNNGSTTTSQITANNITGGALAAQIKFRDVNLVDAKNELGRLATTLAIRFNQVHALGTNLNGVTGQPLFTAANPVSFASPANTGAGTMSVVISDPSSVQASDYRIDFDGTQYSVLRASDGRRTTYSSMPQVIDGLTINIAGAVAAGDSFQLQPFRAGASSIALAINDPRALALGLTNTSGDNRNGLALAAVADNVVLQGLTFSQAFGEISAKIGTTTRGLQTGRDVSAQLLQQARADQSVVSGVNLDEEAAKLIRYQQAYQASAKVIATAQTVFQSLLEMGR